MNTVIPTRSTVARVGLGLIFTIFGLNKLLHFLPQPPMSGPPAEFFGVLAATGYMLPLIALTEIVSGTLLLSNRFVPLALTLLAPVIVNIAAFHAFLAPSGLPLVIVLLAVEIYLARRYRDAFSPMLRARTTLSGGGEERISGAEARNELSSGSLPIKLASKDTRGAGTGNTPFVVTTSLDDRQ